jgi:hypothetical protein
MNTSNLQLFNVRTSDGYANFTIALSNVLRGFVFQPELYVDGVPALRVASFGYKELNMSRMDNGQNGPGGLEEFSNDLAKTKTTYKSRKTYVKYHVNPTNANVQDLQNLQFVAQANDEYINTRRNARASSDFKAEAKFHDFTDGILTVEVIVHGEPATDEHISVIALQTNRQDGENVTSDYATVIKSNMNDIHIADKVRYAAGKEYHYRTVLHSLDTSCPLVGIQDYAVTHLNDVNGESCDLQLRWDDEQGINIWKYVMAHEIADPCREADLEALGFEWKLDLVQNFKYGQNKTDQAEYVTFDPSTGILKAKKDIYGESAIDRTPVIRVRIMDGNKTVKLAYIKVKIVRGTPEPIADPAMHFKMGQNFKFKCQSDDSMISYDYRDFSIQVLKELHMSKDEFHNYYPVPEDIKIPAQMPQGVKFQDADGNWVTVTSEVGYVQQHIDNWDQLEEGTHVLEWFISNDDLWRLSEDAAKGGKPITIYNVYRYWNPNTGRSCFIVLEAQIDPIEKTYFVNGNGEYADNYWFKNNSGKKYGYTEFNVAVPDPEDSEDFLKCIFKNDLNSSFKNENGVIKFNVPYLSDIEYYFTSNNNRTVSVALKTTRNITIYKKGDYELWAKGNDRNGVSRDEMIAKITNNGSPMANYMDYNKNSVLAKELLNNIATKGLDVNEAVMEVYIGIRANVCGQNGSKKRQVNINFYRDNNDGVGNAKNFYIAHIVKPVKITSKDMDDYFIDGVDFGERGSYIDIENCLGKLEDWRGRDFANHDNYLKYYGPFSVTFDTRNALCNLSINGNTSWKQIPQTIEFSVDPSKGKYGYLTYKNNGFVVEDDFKIKVDVDVNYGWGTYVIEGLLIDVQATKNVPF